MSNLLINISICLRGDDLDPDFISKTLNLLPTSAQKKGGNRPGSKNVIAKFGMWNFNIKSDSRTVGDIFEEVLSKISNPPKPLNQIKGVEDAHIDIFLAQDNRKEVNFFLTVSQMAKLTRLGLSIYVTLA